MTASIIYGSLRDDDHCHRIDTCPNLERSKAVIQVLFDEGLKPASIAGEIQHGETIA